MDLLKDKLIQDEKEFEMERKKYAELLDQFQEKSRQHKKLQSMYDKLKRKSILDVHTQQQQAVTDYNMAQENYYQTQQPRPLINSRSTTNFLPTPTPGFQFKKNFLPKRSTFGSQ